MKSATLDNDIRFSDSRHPVELIESQALPEAHVLAAEVIARVFGWVMDGRTLDDRGFRATVAIFTIRPDLFDGTSLERMGESTGRSKQAVWKVQRDFRRVITMEE